MVNKPKIVRVTLLLALVLAVAMVLPTIVVADGNEINLSVMADGNTTLAILAGESAADMSTGTGQAVEAMDTQNLNDTSDEVESGNVTFPAQGNYIFAEARYIVTWTCNWLPKFVSVGIMPVDVDGTHITWLYIMEARPCDNRLEFYAPILDTGTHKTVIVLDHDGEQEVILGDTFSLINESVYVPPPPPTPE